MPNLRYLQCEKNNLKELDLLSTPDLKAIRCDNVNLKIKGWVGKFDNWRENIARPQLRLVKDSIDNYWSWRKAGWSLSSDPVFKW